MLYNKYSVTKTDGTPVDENAIYFVLRLDTGEAARAAILTYAKEIKPYHPEFCEQLRDLVNGIESRLRGW